jgi:CHAT domain-containing protein
MGTVEFPQTYRELFESLGTKDYDVIHFACHGDFDTDQPGESVIMLPDGTKLQPADFLTQPIMSRFNENQPLIFLNSCNSARTGPTLIGVAGWAEEFIKMGCGAFIGCGWEVDDMLAADFAIAFYEAFKNGQSLGKAVYQARLQIKEKDESNSTWLAYYLYGNPNCIMRNESQASTHDN